MHDGSGEVSEPQLFMRLPELSDLPPAPPHEPSYALRTAGPADHGQIAELLSEAFADRWDAKRVAAEFSAGNGAPICGSALCPSRERRVTLVAGPKCSGTWRERTAQCRE